MAISLRWRLIRTRPATFAEINALFYFLPLPKYVLQDFLSKEEYKMPEYNPNATGLRLDNVTASWDEVCVGKNNNHPYTSFMHPPKINTKIA